MHGKNFAQIKDAYPDLESDKIKALADELDKIQLIRGVLDTEGGKILVEEFRSSAASSLGDLRRIYLTASRDEIVSLLNKYFTNLERMATLRVSADDEKELQQMLDDEIREIIG